MRVGFAQAVIHDPAALILDEPTDGLDPEGLKWFRDFILQLREERGMTVLFNSHLLAEVELMCDRVAILREGQRVFEGSVNRIREGVPTYQVSLETWEKGTEIVRSLGGEIIAQDKISLPAEIDPAQFVERLVHAGVKVREFARVRRSLEDVYMEILDGKGSPN